MIILVSCSESTTSETVDKNTQMLNYLAASGFNTENAIFEEDRVIIEGDIAIRLEDLEKRMANKTETRDKQWRTDYQISSSRVRNIRVRLSSSLDSDWKASARSAMAQLNSVPNSAVYLYEVSSGEDIYVRHSSSVGSARGEFPSSSGRAGYSILISYNISPTGYYRNTMLHEFGHNIGLRHDHAPREGGVTWDHLIDGTPYSDTYSVMSYNRSRYFTNYDKIAIAELYPD